ncbi:Molybdopterin oxidoreductase, partial [hydrothermal vent metagenome]
MNKKILNTKNPVSRRDFIKSSAFVGGATVGSSLLGFGAFASMTKEQKAQLVYTLRLPENQIQGACLQCHNACSIKGKIYNGLLAKIDGNPYGPQTMLPNIDYKSALPDSAPVDGKVCPKGQAGIQTVYDPYRIKKVLKRAGKRGENKWVTIDFDKAVTEIVNGGNLFGEGHVKGFKEVRVLTDPKLSKIMAADAKAFGKGEMTLAAFKKKHAAHLDVLIDPDHPDMGPKNNRFVMMCGRIEHGRKELGKRFTHNAFGSNNFFEHTTICEQSHHIGHIQITNKWVVADGKGKWKGGKEHLKPDLLHSEFVIFFGTGAFEANFGKTSMAQKVTDGIVERNFKMAVVDPRMSKTAAKAKWWVPVKPGADSAFAWALIRSIMANKRYDKTFLSNANLAAAHASGERSFSDAPLLVVIENGRPTKFLRASDLGIGKNTEFVCIANGRPVKVDVNDKNHSVKGDLFVDTEVKGIKVKSSLQLVRDEAFSKTLGEWAATCQVEPRMIEEIATEFTSHGKKAACDLYRGAVQHTNGYYNAVAIIYL